MSTTSTSPACALPGLDPQAGLGGVEGDGDARPARPRPATTPVEASTPLGTSTLTTGAPAPLDRVDRLGDRAVRLALEAGAEQRVDDRSAGALERPAARRARAARPTDRRRGAAAPRRAGARGSRARRPCSSSGGGDADDVDLAAGLAQQARDDEPVAAVVALAAHDRRPARRARAARPRARRPRRRAPSDRARARPARRSPSGRSPRIVSASGSGVEPARAAHPRQRC